MEHFTGGRYSARRKLNNMLRDIGAFKHITGSDLINIQRTLSGPTVGLNFGILQQRLPKAGGKVIHIAYYERENWDPTDVDYMLCFLDSYGGPSADRIKVYFDITGAGNNYTNLMRSTPQPRVGMGFPVQWMYHPIFSPTTKKWWCLTVFQYWRPFPG